MPPLPPLPNCADGIDNDGDGLQDDADADCAAPGTGEYYLTNCDDDADQDGDGLFDLDDPDCRLSEGGAGEFVPPIVIPEAVAETIVAISVVDESIVADGDSTEYAAAVAGTQAEEVFTASGSLTDPANPDGAENAEAVE